MFDYSLKFIARIGSCGQETKQLRGQKSEQSSRRLKFRRRCCCGMHYAAFHNPPRTGRYLSYNKYSDSILISRITKEPGRQVFMLCCMHDVVGFVTFALVQLAEEETLFRERRIHKKEIYAQAGLPVIVFVQN
jgi:hypothetical protein